MNKYLNSKKIKKSVSLSLRILSFYAFLMCDIFLYGFIIKNGGILSTIPKAVDFAGKFLPNMFFTPNINNSLFVSVVFLGMLSTCIMFGRMLMLYSIGSIDPDYRMRFDFSVFNFFKQRIIEGIYIGLCFAVLEMFVSLNEISSPVENFINMVSMVIAGILLCDKLFMLSAKLYDILNDIPGLNLEVDMRTNIANKICNSRGNFIFDFISNASLSHRI